MLNSEALRHDPELDFRVLGAGFDFDLALFFGGTGKIFARRAIVTAGTARVQQERV